MSVSVSDCTCCSVYVSRLNLRPPLVSHTQLSSVIERVRASAVASRHLDNRVDTQTFHVVSCWVEPGEAALMLSFQSWLFEAHLRSNLQFMDVRFFCFLVSVVIETNTTQSRSPN